MFLVGLIVGGVFIDDLKSSTLPFLVGGGIDEP
jgi:hypothetical protein